MKTLQDLVIDAINDLNSDELIELNNTYCQENSIESEVYANDEDFFDVYFSGKPMEVARAISYGEYHYSHDNVQFNGYGNLESFNGFTVDQLCELPSVIALHVIENPDLYDMIDIEELETELENED